MPRGDNTLYNQARYDLVVEAVRKGNYRTTAARIAGVSPWTLRSGSKRGDRVGGRDPYGDPRARYR